MKSTVVSVLGFAATALAHGIVSNLTIDGEFYELYNPYSTPYKNPIPELIGWTVQSNGPVEDVSSSAIACNAGSTAGKLSATAAAGASIKFSWTEWPESHRGPVMTYLANCHGDCSAADPATLDFFKIDEAGLLADGTWISDSIIKDGSTYTASIPSDIAPGNYLLRHELLALHGAGSVNGAQFYPVCANLEITGTGTAVPTDTVKFPGGYKSDDAGILINIYYPVPTSYVIPGPPVYTGGAAPAASSAVYTTSASSSVAAYPTDEPTTSVAAYPTEEPTTSVAAYPTEEPTTTLAPYPTEKPSSPSYGNYSTSYFQSTLPWSVTVPTELLSTLIPYPTEDASTEVYPTEASSTEAYPTEEASSAYPTEASTPAYEEPTTTVIVSIPIGTNPAYTTPSPSAVAPVASYSSVGTDGVMTSTLVSTIMENVTTTVVQTIKFTLTVQPTSTATEYDNVPETATTVYKTVTVTPTSVKQKTVTVTATYSGKSKIPACTPAGRYRSYWN